MWPVSCRPGSCISWVPVWASTRHHFSAAVAPSPADVAHEDGLAAEPILPRERAPARRGRRILLGRCANNRLPAGL